MLTVYYYPEANLDCWYMFQVIDSTTPLLVMTTDDCKDCGDYSYEVETYTELQKILSTTYDIPDGVFNPAVICIQTESLTTLQLSHPEFFI